MKNYFWRHPKKLQMREEAPFTSLFQKYLIEATSIHHLLDLNHQLCYFPHMTPEQMKERLEKHYPGCKIEVFDLTGTQDHYEVFVESSIFSGMTRIQQHQHVMACFGPELKTGEVHALSIKTKIG